ncbi:MAG TPA: ParB/RepB/Spo0J family partition protein [Micropepsaceae bacterium]|nr:ParB/RepB/Spo0J family partition protein [Micropepsaceae bacterium]
MARLGRGLTALLGEAEAPLTGDAAQGVKTIPIEAISANPNQPRQSFGETELEELSRSIAEKGILQPIVVRPLPGSASGQRYQIVAGERRWRAAQKARLHAVPVIVKELSDAETLEIALIENVQRADLNAVEEAQGYQSLMDEFRYTQEELAEHIGKSRSHIANTLRLMQLPEAVRAMLRDGRLTAGHARTLVTARDPLKLAREIVQRGLSVRAAEALARRDAGKSKKAKARKGASVVEKDADTRALEQSIADALGLAAEIHDRGDAGGTVTVTYKTLEQLDEIVRRLTE